jgi:hypothetical protein
MNMSVFFMKIDQLLLCKRSAVNHNIFVRLYTFQKFCPLYRFQIVFRSLFATFSDKIIIIIIFYTFQSRILSTNNTIPKIQHLKTQNKKNTHFFLPLILQFLKVISKASKISNLLFIGFPLLVKSFRHSIASKTPINPGTIPITPLSAQLCMFSAFGQFGYKHL